MSAGLFSKVRRQEGGSNRESKEEGGEGVGGRRSVYMDGWMDLFFPLCSVVCHY